jgi:hypothetical protein
MTLKFFFYAQNRIGERDRNGGSLALLASAMDELLGLEPGRGRGGEGVWGVGESEELVFAHPFEPENGVGSFVLAAAVRTHGHGAGALCWLRWEREMEV